MRRIADRVSWMGETPVPPQSPHTQQNFAPHSRGSVLGARRLMLSGKSHAKALQFAATIEG